MTCFYTNCEGITLNRMKCGSRDGVGSMNTIWCQLNKQRLWLYFWCWGEKLTWLPILVTHETKEEKMQSLCTCRWIQTFQWEKITQAHNLVVQDGAVFLRWNEWFQVTLLTTLLSVSFAAAIPVLRLHLVGFYQAEFIAFSLSWLKAGLDKWEVRRRWLERNSP